jgi:hypothetical protein
MEGDNWSEGLNYLRRRRVISGAEPDCAAENSPVVESEGEKRRGGPIGKVDTLNDNTRNHELKVENGCLARMVRRRRRRRRRGCVRALTTKINVLQ